MVETAKEIIYPNSVDFANFVNLYGIDSNLAVCLYSLVGKFEKSFKNAFLSLICHEYNLKNDSYCVDYIDEIGVFLGEMKIDIANTQNISVSEAENYKFESIEDVHIQKLVRFLPRFCPNFFCIVSKKGLQYCDNKTLFKINKRFELLKSIYEKGCKHSDNELMNHYIRTQGKVPFWALSNALTLGDLTILYEMSHFEYQKKLSTQFYINSDSENQIKNVVKFISRLDYIRRLRNKICHFEPLFPFFVECIAKTNQSTGRKSLHADNVKNIHDSALFNALHEIVVKDLLSYKTKDNETGTLEWKKYNNGDISELGIKINKYNEPYVILMEYLKFVTK